jgi:hypothetical protein
MKKLLTLLFLISLILIISCDQPSSDSGGIIIIDEEVDIYVDQETEPPSYPAARKAGGWRTPVPTDYYIRYVARIPAVTVGGELVQANDISFDTSGKNTAAVAYNCAGPTFMGAVQIVSVSNPRRPRIRNEIAFPGMDINAVEFVDGMIYFTGFADVDTYGNKNFFGVIDPGNVDTTAIMDGLVWFDNSSWAGTGIAYDGTDFYVSVGAAGGEIEIVDGTMASTGSLAPYIDIRDVDPCSDGIIALQGSDGATPQVLIFDSSDMSSPSAIGIGSTVAAENKATIEVYGGDYALLGLSGSGFKLLDIPNGNFDYQLDNPSASWTTAVATNSVSSDGDLIFTANGEYGFRVLKFEYGHWWGDPDVEIVGFYPFDDQQIGSQYFSANHVEAKRNSRNSTSLFVAGGVGGVLIFNLIAK